SASTGGEREMWSGAPALWAATTDQDGRFELRGLGAERLAVLHLSGGGVTESEAYVGNRRALDPKAYNDAVVKNAGGSGKPRWRPTRPMGTCRPRPARATRPGSIRWPSTCASRRASSSPGGSWTRRPASRSGAGP